MLDDVIIIMVHILIILILMVRHFYKDAKSKQS